MGNFGGDVPVKFSRKLVDVLEVPVRQLSTAEIHDVVYRVGSGHFFGKQTAGYKPA